MSERERIRRPEPARTDPIRTASGVFRNGHGAAATSPGATGSGDAPAAAAAGHAPANHPFAWPDDDPVSRAVRAGCDVVEKAVRRGFGLGRDPSSGSAAATPWAGAWTGAGLPGPLTGRWTTGQCVDAMTGAFTWWAQWFDAWSSMARSVMSGGAEPAPGAWPPSTSPSQSPSPSPSPYEPASPSAAPGALHVTIELRTPRAVSVELDLATRPASDSSPGAVALAVHGLLAPAAAAAPPITDVTVAMVDRGFAVTLGSLDHHPAGTYAGAVLAAGRACGTLTVRLT
jgi:hypothetical protein